MTLAGSFGEVGRAQVCGGGQPWSPVWLCLLLVSSLQWAAFPRLACHLIFLPVWTKGALAGDGRVWLVGRPQSICPSLHPLRQQMTLVSGSRSFPTGFVKIQPPRGRDSAFGLRKLYRPLPLQPQDGCSLGCHLLPQP